MPHFTAHQTDTTCAWLESRSIAHTITPDGGVVVNGELVVGDGATTDLSALTSVGDALVVCECATADLPALTSVGVWLVVREGATADLPALTSVGDGLVVYPGATADLPALTSVGDGLVVYRGATADLPALTSVGHVCCPMVIAGHKVEVLDGLATVMLSSRTAGERVIRRCRWASFKDGALVGDPVWVVSDGDTHAHGETLKSALADLAYKMADRDPSAYRDMPLDTVKTPEEWALIYRVVTGACRSGVEEFMQRQGALRKTYTLRDILDATRGAYAAEEFQDVVTGTEEDAREKKQLPPPKEESSR